MRVALAGTFGPVHDGHRALFETALEVGDDGVVVGLTSGEFARQSRTREVPPLSDRISAVESELAALDEWGREVELRTIEDERGGAASDPALDALVVSPETIEGLYDINDRRRGRGLDPLTGVVVPYVEAEDGERVSSTRVVAGEIDEHGRRRDDDGS